MLSENIIVDAQERKISGKSATKNLRKNGRIPVNIYSKGQESILASIGHKELLKKFNEENFFSRIFIIEIENKKVKLLPKEVTFHPVTDDIEHVDFYLVNDKEKVKIKSNLRFLNESSCKGVKQGGVLNIAARKIELLCLPNNIVSELKVDLKDLEIGDSLHVSDLELPENVELAKKSLGITILTLLGRTEETASQNDDKADEKSEEKTEEKKQ